jgi:hypothetical protein
MYRVLDARINVTFRLQLFISDARLRPVAVATQDMADGGTSVIDDSGRCASRVWSEYFPDDQMRPAMIHLLRPPIDRDS